MRATIQECEKSMNKRDDPLIARVHPYKSIIKGKVISDNVEPATKVIDKGKQKMVRIHINEPVVTTKNNLVMSKMDLELEQARQEKEELAKELEKIENEVTGTEMRRQITFLKSTQSQANCASHGQGMSSGNITQTTNIPSTSSLGTSSNTTKQNVVGTTSNVNN